MVIMHVRNIFPFLVSEKIKCHITLSNWEYKQACYKIANKPTIYSFRLLLESNLNTDWKKDQKIWRKEESFCINLKYNFLHTLFRCLFLINMFIPHADILSSFEGSAYYCDFRKSCSIFLDNTSNFLSFFWWAMNMKLFS